MFKKLLLTVFLVVSLFLANTVFGQSVGDYRSNVNTTGIWTASSSWEYYNGSAWVAATNYPGEIAGTYAVSIQTGDIITIGVSGITTEIMGTLTINGSLILTGTNTGGSGTNFIFETQTIIVTPLLGTITFIDKVNLKLPTNATLQVTKDLTPNPDYYGLIGDCNHNQDIYIGTNVYAYCNGGGSTGLTFDEVMNGGGTLNAIATSNSPICQGSTINLFGSYTGAAGLGLTYSWSITNPNSVVTTTSAQNPTVSNAISGTYTATLTCSTTYNSNVYSNSETITVTVNVLPTIPTIGTITQPTCTLATGTIAITAPIGDGTTYSINGLTYTNTSGVFTSVASGIYSVTAKNSSGCISNATSVTIKSATNTWNGSTWSNGSTPIITENIVFNGNYASPSSLDGCSCTVNAGVFVNINSGHTLNLTNGLTVDTSGFGEITFLDGASLLQSNPNPNINSGDVDYIRTTNTVVRNTDYTYWSSPVSPQTLGDFSPDTPDGMMYSYNSSIEDWKQEYLSTTMNLGIGYIVRGPEPSGIPVPPAPYTASFVGVPNNGTINIPIVYSGAVDGTSNLLGNPYPSALDADTFLFDNAGVLEGTIYFWTHNTQIGIGVSDPGTGVYAYSGNDYASYNSVGGVGVGSASLSGITVPSGKIAAGQGFFATSIAAGTVTFTNAMRVSGNNTQFFKKRNSKTEKGIEKNRVWLNLTNTQGAFKQTLIGYVTDATNEYDSRFDGESFDGNEFVDFYSVNQDKNLVIQGRALPFDENDEVPLGYRTTINGDFTINIDQVDGLLSNQAVFIEDKLTNTVFDLKNGNYTFNTVAGTFNDRFVLRYKDNSTAKTLGTANINSIENKVLVSNKNKQIKINSFVETIDKVEVYDLLGRQIYQKDNVNSNEFLMSNLMSSHQTLVVKTSLQNGTTVTDKIIY